MGLFFKSGNKRHTPPPPKPPKIQPPLNDTDRHGGGANINQPAPKFGASDRYKNAIKSWKK